MWYAGSTERCTFREAGEEKGVLLVDLAKGSVTPIDLPARPMLDLPRLDVAGASEADAVRAIYARLGTGMDGAIARLRVTGLAPHVYATLDFARVKALTAGALHFDLQAELARDDAAPGQAAPTLGAIADELDAFLGQRSVGSADREALAATAKELLREAGAV